MYLPVILGQALLQDLEFGISSINAISTTLNKPSYGISSLLGLAYNVAYFDGIICPIIDAKNDNIYSAFFKFKNGKLELIDNYIAENIDYLINKLSNLSEKVLFIGDGANIHIEKLSTYKKCYFAPSHFNSLNATSIAKAAFDEASLDTSKNYSPLLPLYLKKSQAERMLEMNESNKNI